MPFDLYYNVLTSVAFLPFEMGQVVKGGGSGGGGGRNNGFVYFETKARIAVNEVVVWIKVVLSSFLT